MKSTLIKTTLIFGAAAIISACNKNLDAEAIKVGTIAGPETVIMQEAARVANEQYDLQIKVVEFNDYVTPNLALNDGAIDANAYQTPSFMEEAIASRGYDFTIVGKTFLYPMAVYSDKWETLDAIPDNAEISIPNDPSNAGRALLILQDAGLLKLDPSSGILATPNDITENKKELKFIQLDAAQLPRSLQDVDASVINQTFAIPAGLLPTEDGIYIEGNTSPYVNIIVVDSKNKDADWVAPLVKAYNSNEVLAIATEEFAGQAIPGWEQ